MKQYSTIVFLFFFQTLQINVIIVLQGNNQLPVAYIVEEDFPSDSLII